MNELFQRIVAEGFPCEATFEELLGEHELTGVDYERSRSFPKHWDPTEFEDCECLRFVLGRITFMAIQDPSDGYRSSMREFFITDEPVKYTFPPRRVRVEHVKELTGDYRDERVDVLELIDVKTSRPILRVGTTNVGDYYPCWLAQWDPNELTPL